MKARVSQTKFGRQKTWLSKQLIEELLRKTKIHMIRGPTDLERRQLNWTHVHRVVSSFLTKRVSLTKIAI